jgi:ElaB/YqjD/DUF883 family membrane-anchored ribosome-binding protein
MSSLTPSDQLIQDLQTVIKDAEVLLQNSAAPLGEEFKSAKARFEQTIKNAKDEAIRLEKLVVKKTKEAMNSTDSYVKEKPWQAVGLSAAVGLVIGMLISRR